MMTLPTAAASSELVLRLIPMPADSGADGPVASGWLMGKLDTAGSMPAIRITRGRVVLATVDKLVFAHPIFPGDIVTLYATVLDAGAATITVRIDAMTQRRGDDAVFEAASCQMTYAAGTEAGPPADVPQ